MSVGIVNVLIYAGATWVSFHVLAVSAATASAFGYAVAVPVAFIGHRRVTFDVDGKVTPQFARFIITQLIGFSVAVLVSWLVCDWGGLQIAYGVVSAAVIVPLISYLMMDRWVFQDK